jgi:adenylylsulfate kinase-like enzyme
LVCAAEREIDHSRRSRAAAERIDQNEAAELTVVAISLADQRPVEAGAGKSSIANLVDKRLCDLGRHTTLLDGDKLRHGINRDLGFTNEARVENIRRVAEIAKLFVDAGMIALCR